MTGERMRALTLTAGFLAVIGVVPLAQAVIELSRREPPQAFDLFRHVPTKAHLRSFEHELEGQSWFATTLRPPMQYARFVLLHDGGEKAIAGRSGWWFYRPGVRYLVEPYPPRRPAPGPGHDVIRAVVSFRDRLRERGIRLIVVPVPGKPSVYPDYLTRRAPPEPLDATHTRRVISELRAAGVNVVDLMEAFADARREERQSDGDLCYLARDTHWTPRGLRLAAEVVAHQAMALDGVSMGTIDYDAREVVVYRPGDVLEMLRAPAIVRRFEPERVPCDQVYKAETGEPYQDDPDAEILVLGDSFLRIYERDKPGSAGFIAHLACKLHRPVDSIVNDGGASTLVRQQLARDAGRLDGKTLVIWEFVERDIRFGLEGWQEVELPAP